jgi:hypothetical protein
MVKKHIDSYGFSTSRIDACIANDADGNRINPDNDKYGLPNLQNGR